MGNVFISSLTQLLGQIPVLLVYFVGLFLALLFWQRCRTAALLVLLGSGLLLVTSVMWPLVIHFALQARSGSGWQQEHVSTVVSGLGFLSSCIRAVGVGLLLAAAFVGRGTAPDSPPVSAAT